MQTTAGVIGAGIFGLTVSTLLSHNCDVLLYTRDEVKAKEINEARKHLGYDLPNNVILTSNLEALCSQCKIIFPVLPSEYFREMMIQMQSLLTPAHLMIHGTKGLDVSGISTKELENAEFSKEDINTMSEIILQETNVIRVGCLSGPNLAREILDGQPTACVVASEYDEIIQIGQKLLSSKKFFVFGTHDLKGAELAGAFKNIIALGSGLLEGLGMGRNLQAMFIVRALHETISMAQQFGSSSKAFLGTAGIGDIIATSTSDKSRNFTVGRELAKGRSLDEILREMDEVAEGLRTLRITYGLAVKYDIRVPIIELLHEVIFEEQEPKKAIEFLMRYPMAPDVDFL